MTAISPYKVIPYIKTSHILYPIVFSSMLSNVDDKIDISIIPNITRSVELSPETQTEIKSSALVLQLSNSWTILYDNTLLTLL